MKVSHWIKVAGILIGAATTIAVAYIKSPTITPTNATVFQTPMVASDKNCYQICAARDGVCLGARRTNDESVDCDFRGVKGDKGFELRAKSCSCRK